MNLPNCDFCESAFQYGDKLICRVLGDEILKNPNQCDHYNMDDFTKAWIKELSENKFKKLGCYVTCKNGNGLSVETDGSCDLEIIKCKNHELYELDVYRMMDYLN